MAGIPVVIKASGGLPVTVSTRGTPMEVASNGYGIAVTEAPNGLPVSGISFAPAFEYAGWDPATVTAVTLSGSNLIATNTGTTANEQGAKGVPTAGKTSGKHYFEITFTAFSGSLIRVAAGVAPSASTYAAFSTGTTSGDAVCANGVVHANGVGTVADLIAGNFPVGATVGIAVDLDNRTCWFAQVPGGLWNNSAPANPATNTGGFTVPAGTMLPYCAFGGTSGVAGNITTANFGATAFAGAVPSGFTAGWTIPETVPPVITSTNTISNAEGTVLAHTLTANESVTWAIVAGGADNARFEISGSTLRWLSNGTKDFEAPNDANVDNAYIVTVRATDLAANPSTTQTITVTVTDVAAAAGPDAPVLDLLTDGTDNTPDFTLTGDLLVADTVRFQYSTSAVFSGASEITNTIDAGEDAANSLSFATGTLANGTWYFRARIERPSAEGAGISGWSNTETVVINVVSSYAGPGDVVATWAAWVGLRAFSAATRGTPCCRIKQTVSLGEQDINTDPTTGVVDQAAIAAFFAAGSGGQGYIYKMYDQTGNGRHLGAGATGGTGTPNVAYSSPGSIAAMSATGVGSNSAGIGTAYPQPFTYVGAGLHVTAAGQGALMAGGGAQIGFSLSGAANSSFLYAGAVLSGAATADDARHVLIGVFNGASSVMRVDSTETTGAGGAAALGAGDSFSLGTAELLYTFEGGILGRAINSTERTDLANNMKTYFGIA